MQAAQLSNSNNINSGSGSGSGGQQTTHGSTNNVPITPPLTIVFENVTVVGPSSKQVVLDEASGVLRGGRLTAIVSCCGARGDYYLLNALAGHLPTSSGSIWANGVPVLSKQYRRGAAFIDEEVTTFEDLTVRENLAYSAKMRSASYDSAEIESIIDDLELRRYTRVRLADCPTFARRRVLIGKELVLDPFLLCVDSAVQGLTSDRAVIALRMLREMALRDNRAVAVTMVQPRWALLRHVDDVMLVEGSKVVFVGSTEEALAATRKVSQLYLPRQPASVTAQSSQSQSQQQQQQNSKLQRTSAAAAAAATADSPEHLINDLYRVASSPSMSLADSLRNEGRMPEIETQIVEYLTRFAGGEGGSLPARRVRVQPSAAKKLFFLFNSTLNELRNNVLVYTIISAMLLLIALALAIIYKAQSGQTGMQNRIGIIFFLVSSTYLHNILTVDRQRRAYNSFLRHWQHGYFGPATYLCHWVLSSAIFRFALCAFFTMVVYCLANIGSSWDFTSLSDLVIVVALTSFSTSVLVFFVCIVVPTTRIAHFILFTLYAINVILAGIILNVNTLPRFFKVVSLGTHIRLGYESAVLTQFEGQSFGCDPHPPTPNPTASGSGGRRSGVEFAAAGEALLGGSNGASAAIVGVAGRLLEAAAAGANAAFGNETTAVSTSAATTVPTTTTPFVPQACYTGDEYLSFLGFEHGRKWTNLMIMGIETAIFIVLAYIVMLVFRTPKKVR